jgi:NAD(P)-dependent dehydrogenase (short-subunit alcohol dehydrogenase family)
MLQFDGRIVVVTGGTGALGSAIVRLMVAQGARCVVPSHRAGEALSVRGPGSVEIVPGVDLSEERAVEKFYAALPSCWASIHTAGGYAKGAIATLTKGDLMKMLELNAVTAFLCCREAVKRMRNGGNGGRIVNVAGKVAVAPVGGMTPYSMSKAAVVSLTQSLAEEVAGEEIWVNAVVPSIMDTPANRASFPPGTDYTKWPKVEEVAETVAFLASPENKVTRGALVPVYGKNK